MNLDRNLISILERCVFPDEWEKYPDTQIKRDQKAIHEVNTCIHRWEKIYRIFSSQAVFEERLNKIGLNRSGLSDYLSLRSLMTDNLPKWALFFLQVMTHTRPANEKTGSPLKFTAERLVKFSGTEKDLYGVNLNKTPLFPHFLNVFIEKALSRLASAYDVGDGVRDILSRFLLLMLSDIVRRSIAYDVKECSRKQLLKGETPHRRYQFYATKILGTNRGRKDFFNRYPMAARLLSVRSLGIINSVGEMLGRFHKDRKRIIESIFNKKETGPLIAIYPGLSDFHGHSRSVMLLAFASGQKLVYKPRGFQTDEIFNIFVGLMNTNKDMLSLKPPRFLDGRAYGWMEYIEKKPCRHDDDISRFYQRHGQLLFLIHLTAGYDFHHDNFIPHGECPVPVDLEGIFREEVLRLSPEFHNCPDAFLPLELAPLNSGNLPLWYKNENGRAFVTSGIGGTCKRKIKIRRPAWINVATDQLSLDYKMTEIEFTDNMPELDGEKIAVTHYVKDVTRGYTNAFRFFYDNKKQIADSIKRKRALFESKTRKVIRDTKLYQKILFWAHSPDLLSSGSAFYVALERICQFNFSPDLYEFLDQEKQHLRNNDVPVFFQQINFDAFLKRLESLDTARLDWHVKLVGTALKMTQIKPGVSDHCGEKEACFLETAKQIADSILKVSFTTEQGNMWLDLKPSAPGSDYLRYCMSDFSLYRGVTGVAVFLANLFFVTKDLKYKTCALGFLKYAESVLGFTDKHKIPVRRFSVFHGYFSFIYALTECGRLFGDTGLVDTALRYALMVNENDIVKEKRIDFTDGLSGVLLSLLKLYGLTADKSLLNLAVLMGNHILTFQNLRKGGFHITQVNKELAGMAHGSSGIAYALLKLYEIRQDKIFLNAIQKSLEFERSIFCPFENDWPDLQTRAGKKTFMTGWCSGAPGIGLERLALLNIAGGDKRIKEDIDHAVLAAKRNMNHDKFHACCGDMGNIYFLNEAGKILNKEDYLRCARQSAQKIIRFHQEHGYWKLLSINEGNIIPGLMNGVSGLGLTLLRLAEFRDITPFLTLYG